MSMLPAPTAEVLTPAEAARWFKRSPSWLRAQRELLRAAAPNGRPRYHVRVCRAYLLGRMAGLSGDALRRVQLEALAGECRLAAAALEGADRSGLGGDGVSPAPPA